MSLVWMRGFGHLPDGDVDYVDGHWRGIFVSGNTGTNAKGLNGPDLEDLGDGHKALTNSPNANGMALRWVTPVFDDESDTIAVGCRIYWDGSIPNSWELFTLHDGGVGTEPFDSALGVCWVDTSGRMRYNPNQNVLGNAFSSGVVFTDVGWYFAEWVIHVHNSTGYVEFWVDGVKISEEINVDTRGSGTLMDRLRFARTNWGLGCKVTDVYVHFGTRQGDSEILSRMPVEDGSTNDWTASGGGDHFEDVDEIGPDADSSYVSTTGDGDRELYGIAEISGGNTVRGLQVTARAKVDSAGTAGLKLVCKSGASESVSAAKLLTTTDDYVFAIFETDPATGLAWTQDGINDAEFGFESDGVTTEEIRVTQLAVEVMQDPSGEQPDTPTIEDADPICEDSVTVCLSAFSSPVEGRTHRASRYQAYRLDTGALVYDSGYLTDDLICHAIPLPVAGIGYKIHALQQDNELWDSPWSPWFYVTAAPAGSGVCDPPPPDFNTDDWFLGWNTTPNDIGQYGGWMIPSGPEARYTNQLIQYRRYFTYPAAMLSNVLPPYQGQRVSGNVMFWSCECEWWPWRYFECELADGGICALAAGEITLVNPQCIHIPGCQAQQAYTGTPITGVWAYIHVPILKQYGGCGIKGYGFGDGRLSVRVYWDGHVDAQWNHTIPAAQMQVVVRDCLQYPWYNIVLEVERDFGTDPTGRTHDIRAAWAPGFNAADPDTNGWDIEETWVGGAEESEEGAGDGGLPCGFPGYASSRYTGGSSLIKGGWTLFRGFTATGLNEEDECVPGPPPPTGNGTEIPPPLPPTQSSPCPPEAPGAFSDLFLGGKEVGGVGDPGVYQYGGWEVDENGVVFARIQTNPFAGAGFGGEMLVKNIYLTLTHRGDVSLRVTPIPNGELLEEEAKELFKLGTGEESGPVRFELPLSRPNDYLDERVRDGIRCQDFAVRIDAFDICEKGFSLDGIEIEWEPVRESHPNAVFTEELLAEPFYIPPVWLFLGQKAGAGRVFGASDAPDDDGTPFDASALSNWVLPAGVGGEVIFTNVYLTLTHWNTEALTVLVTPQIKPPNTDAVLELDPVEVLLEATTRPITTVHEVPVTIPYTR